MKILLTIEEYKERITKLVMDMANTTINPNGNNYFKMEYINLLVKECVTDNFHYVDFCNQMFINTFGRDRNGKLWSKENIKQIDDEEAEEFNSQEWYKKYNEKARKNYVPTKYMCSCSENDGTDEDVLNDTIFIEEVVSTYFLETDLSMLSLEIFKKLYGHDYEIDRDFKCE